MALRTMGTGHFGSFSFGNKADEVFSGGHRLLHQMVEAEPLANITQQNVKNFVWKNIVCRYGVPKVLVFDTLEFRTIIPHLHIPKPTTKLKLQTDPC